MFISKLNISQSFQKKLPYQLSGVSLNLGEDVAFIHLVNYLTF